jgi:hypothetical protein
VRQGCISLILIVAALFAAPAAYAAFPCPITGSPVIASG